MNIAVISSGTFSEEHYKTYFNSCDETKLSCVCSVDDELPDGHYDVIAVDYYNENLNPHSIDKFVEKHPESIIIILADVDFEEDDLKKEEKILKKFCIEYATCFDIKEDEDAKDFYDFAKIMIDTKKECESVDAPFTTNVIAWALIFLAFVLLGLIYYFH